jgi:hypothetical protein
MHNPSMTFWIGSYKASLFLVETFPLEVTVRLDPCWKLKHKKGIIPADLVRT